ncbi:MAG: DUF488 family protein [Armatimonadota bacterium]|nr:DUF488 family protein [Armatimonadota bacterium]MDR7578703.1 DUF488 family protein [Armatimonadota bacterium]MDR7595886.1 DUF488 family protein [Armatimonadota bacterium]
MLRVRRVYEPPEPQDGFRVLVDRLWPRGLSKEAARVDLWARELAPSDRLRRWFGHDPVKWEEFRRRYREELSRSPARELVQQLAERARHGTVTLVFGARDERHNNAVVLAEVLQERLAGTSGKQLSAARRRRAP